MPPETTKRRQKIFSEEELKDIEQKRIRGELSCAECRRLKLRCDKKVPCSSCCRRGCESICPCGILSAGQGTRFILADTDHLHRKITEMSQRIRSLEDALAILQASVSEERHPLLDDELLKIKFGAEAANRDRRPAETQAIDALGTLTLTDEGDMRYFGRSAGSETLIAGEEWDNISDYSSDDSTELSTSPSLEKATTGFLFSQAHMAAANVASRLPPRDRAHVLCQLYIDHASLFFRPIKRDELFDLFLPDIYKEPNSAVPHTLATLFFVFALGALFDLRLGAYNKEAELYYHLGLTALSLKHVLLDAPQINTIRAVGLMATYHSMASKKYSRDTAWFSMGLAVKLALSIGLHRDSARWHMEPRTVQMRRNLWWEIFSSDVSHSLALGRPPAVHLSFVDCEFPTDEEATLSQSGDIEFGFWRMKYTFARDIFSAVVDATLTAQTPSYATILDLDKKVRQMTFPSSFKPYVKLEDGVGDYYSSAKSLRDFYASQHRTVTMLYLHRSYFAQSILDSPSNPLLSPFAPSFLTAYRSASVMIKAAAHQFDRSADAATRVWFLLYHIFSSAVVVGSVVTRSPNTTIARSALEDLELAIRLFETCAAKSQRARVALGILRKLRDKAIVSYTQSRLKSRSPESDMSDKSSTQPPYSESEDELAIFGGQTKVLTKRHRSKNSLQFTGFPASTTESTPSPGGPAAEAKLHKVNVHPSLMDYIKDGGGGMMTTTEPRLQIHGQWSPQTVQPFPLSSGSTFANVPPTGTEEDHGFSWNAIFDLPSTNWTETSPLYSIGPASAGYHPQTLYAPPVNQTPQPQYQPPESGISSNDLNWFNIQHPPPVPVFPAVNAAALAELGLMTESNMDPGWLSFMHECGIVVADPTVGLSSGLGMGM
ncbi:uncharacterized protein BT62DRAFT_45886 [Guyanagaster necrorhizus]|uniref:Zn(2)-C6 fungal-type domain-containing protein n=1 Tax=Guyanagaster necrorhizus TaxID=856835 RepID=A0A9P8AZ19_9AGAR|nr:uncharacterized protein BT62DRAFT_45886 [Guyanagaster necrorhizus MCA 3950]KAG7453080.1 hypothetical protein BT62DRAFT_45886 [Guyanagaster necrorhizus MCA 3950]